MAPAGKEKPGAELPIVCALGPDDAESRLRRAAELTATALIEWSPTAAGYRLSFDPAAEAELSALIEAESRCCPFMAFSLRAGPEALVLEVEAPARGRPAVAALFGLRRAS